MRRELSERRAVPELDRPECVRERKLRIEPREVDEPKQPDQQAASVGLLARDERVDVGEVFEVLRPGDVNRRHDVPVQGRVDSLPVMQSGRLRRDDIRHVATGLASGGVRRVRIDANCWRFLLHCLGREPESSEELHHTTLEVMVLHCEARSRPPARDREELLLWNS